ncbi:MAG: dihydroorotate dehydrogenase [Oscillospiraceae bacterium]|jgi:dihydroorotate dehydrogenase (NAD+) catalytic subunit|nr:dihydroorotate dehydrogenase [Oscillospiraceae bacterium]
MVDLCVSLAGVGLQNPVIPASGCFGFGREFAEFYDINLLGAFSFKGTTEEPRFGNPLPRVADCPSGMLNSVGLQNPGMEKVLTEELPFLKTYYHQPLIANVGGFSVREYVSNTARIAAEEQVDIVELNISCPNVQGGGHAFGTSCAAAEEVTKACKAVCPKPLFVKLTPNAANITDIAKAAEAAGADGISLINTLLGMRIDLKRRRPVLANIAGGYSGPGIFPVALRMVYETYAAVRIPIMGMGGVSTARDVIEMMLAGATAVQVGAANLVDPYACKYIIEDLPAVCAELGITRLSEMTGAAHGWSA